MKRLKNSVRDRALESASAGGGEGSEGFIPRTGVKCCRQSQGETCPGASLPAGVSPLPKTVPPALVGGHQAPRAGGGGRRRVGAGVWPRACARMRRVSPMR